MIKSRTSTAKALVMQRHWGSIKMSLNQIARECFLAHSTVKAIARKYRKELDGG